MRRTSGLTHRTTANDLGLRPCPSLMRGAFLKCLWHNPWLLERRMTDDTRQVTCIQCLGTGICEECFSRPLYWFMRCEDCEGTRRCFVCGGTGICSIGTKAACPTCGERFYFDDAACAACGKKLKASCPRCEGSGRCKQCSGRGCKFCLKSGKCSRCVGSGLDEIPNDYPASASRCPKCEGTGRCGEKWHEIWYAQRLYWCPECSNTGECPKCEGVGSYGGRPELIR